MINLIAGPYFDNIYYWSESKNIFFLIDKDSDIVHLKKKRKGKKKRVTMISLDDDTNTSHLSGLYDAYSFHIVWSSAYLMSGHHFRWWPNINPTLVTQSMFIYHVY